jgi:hypothetical protein
MVCPTELYLDYAMLAQNVDQYNKQKKCFVDYATPPPTSGFCSIIESNLGLGWLWWLVVIIQLAVLPAIILLQRLCILLPTLSFIQITSILTFYLNTSLWIWTIYLITASAHCGTGLENPLFTSVLILVCSLLACSLLDCVLSREGKIHLLPPSLTLPDCLLLRLVPAGPKADG